MAGQLDLGIEPRVFRHDDQMIDGVFAEPEHVEFSVFSKFEWKLHSKFMNSAPTNLCASGTLTRLPAGRRHYNLPTKNQVI